MRERDAWALNLSQISVASREIRLIKIKVGTLCTLCTKVDSIEVETIHTCVKIVYFKQEI